MVKVSIDYEGDLRCRVTHGPSGEVFRTDAPLDNQGRGESFSPTDLVAAALGACVATVMGILARREGLDLTGLSVAVEKEMVSEPERRVGRLAVTVRLPASLSPAQRKKLEATARTCPVKQSLRPEVEVPITFQYA